LLGKSKRATAVLEPEVIAADEKPSTDEEPSPEEPSRPALPLSQAILAMFLAWLVPGGGHFLLGRKPRAIFFFVWLLLPLAIGCYYQGRLPWMLDGSPLQILATLGAMGIGIPFFVLQFGWGYAGDITAPGFEYGSTFILSAGLMNMLLVLDTWDISVGRKD
jgi:hypothetical protein